jgi:large subunit ribosomal protein L7/L12
LADKKLSMEEMIEAIDGMTVLELSELVKALEEKYGVTAAAPMAMGVMPGMAAGGGGEGDEGGEEAEQTEFDVVLLAAGDKKIQVIKEVRAITGLGLKEAKALVDEAPKPVKEKVNRDEADKVAEQLREAGAQVEIK